jgi:iron complex outermembrane receptor protein
LASQPKVETLHDIELGVEKKQSNYSFGANVYYMIYKDQLVLTGQINDVGSYTRTNVPNSYRLGIEIQGTYVFAKWLNTSANLSFSQNKIQSFTEYIDNWDNGLQNAVQHSNTDISFSPNIIGGATINFIPLKSTTLSLLSKYVSKQYLDNSETDARSLKAFYTEDVKLMYTIKNKIGKEINLIAQVNNVFNSLYLPNGWTYPYIYNHTLYTENGYYPMAGTNFMIAVNIKL